jgi:flagellar protein FliS
MSTTELSYRKSAIEGASPIGLMIALLDALVCDFRRAANAIRKNDIETRCKELDHALLVLGRLETWVDMKNGGEPAQNLSRFYAYLRAKMIEASIKKSAAVLDAQIETIVHVRSAWQQLDMLVPEKPAEHVLVTVPRNKEQYAPAKYENSERIPLSLSA